MSRAPAIMKGVIHGRLIELSEEPGLPDGQTVSVTVQPVSEVEPLPPGEGLRRAFGAWAEDADELDRYVEWSRLQRRVDRREIEP